MAEYIKREAALQIIDYAKQLVNEQIVRDSGAYELLSDTGKACYDSVITTLTMCKRLINEAVIATDIQTVKHGYWEEVTDYGGWGDTHYRCSVCGEEWYLEDGKPKDNNMNFCPRCGAKMIKDGDTD